MMKHGLLTRSILILLSGLTFVTSACVRNHASDDSDKNRLATITTRRPVATSEETLKSHFKCKDLGNGRYRPYYLQAVEGGTQLKDYSQTPKGLLGQNPMPSLEECTQALENANHHFGVICSRTGLNGWKPTLYTGTVPGRADFGYLGGSSIMKFSDCLKATAASSEKGVCYWGGSAWFAGRIDREGNSLAGPFPDVDSCIEKTKPD